MKILIADDEVTNRYLLQVTLNRRGFEVITARDGNEAWEMLQREDAPPLAILDWMMPGIDGVEVCRRVRAIPDLRLVYIIILTTKAQRGDIIEGLQAGADDYVVKPFDPEELHARVQVGVRLLELQRQLADREKELAVTRALITEQQRFEAAVTAMSDGIIVTDGAWRLTTANRAARRLLNLSEDDWNGMALERALQPFALTTSYEDLQSSDETATAFEIARLKTQPPLYLDARLTRLFDLPRTLFSTVLTLRDVTAERHAQHLRANFFMLVSHKLRTPLTVLGGFLDLFKRLSSERREEEGDRLLEVCQMEVEQLEDMVQDLLDFKALNTQKLEKQAQQVNVAEVLASVTQKIQQDYPSKSLEVTTQIAPDALRVNASPDHVGLALEKLLDNAAKFGDKHPVQISVIVEKSEPSWVRFSVSDNGTGIPHEYFDRVLEGFVQVEDRVTGQVPGLGVGLFMARRVVEAYGGSIVIQSRIGAGSTISFTLPVEDER